MTPSTPQAYLRDAVMTASPEQLHLMLYDGAIRFSLQAKDALKARNYEESYNKLSRAQAIILAAKLRAILDNRYHVARDDIRAVAPMALRHRLILNFEGQADGVPTDAVIANVLKTAQEPAAATVA